MTQPYVSPDLRRQIAKDAGHRCGYCLSDEVLTGLPLSIDHIVPVAAGGPTTRENLWLACRPCNEFKGAQTHAEDPETGETVPLFNPRTQDWHTFRLERRQNLYDRFHSHWPSNGHGVTIESFHPGEGPSALGYGWLASSPGMNDVCCSCYP